MTDTQRERPSLKAIDAYADRNGQNLGGEAPLDVGVPSRMQADLKREPNAERAQTAEAIERATASLGKDES